ncbi:MAG: toxin-antitoxin system toxin subunit [Syntrophobacterales bacterium CG_4_8_14_3_um_filter_49_14]|nr:MAG: toxin-antitoxin system toxin subunit [Syntrophobacterales bacterium CG23_combo_of_CG06-09_8_20_14_all_48_27]PJA50491.1 MAG: toxin-antitoxin system toxin subunit [Syntrophobacterales bacterium CG_4_9_14_3_um_filter_49_8]PJC74363.1 MAG: toxin-antitoxin system toxin subunit [Syntrophobacterales bacterium CG_4_8_14_3_um_filter_49_14]
MKEHLSKTDIVNLIRTEKTFLKNEFGVVAIGLFGSYAKGEQNADSDIDILVELKEPRFDWLAGLQIYMEKKFGRKIELVRKSNLVRSRFIERVEKDVIYV